MKVHNPFGRLTQADGVTRLDQWKRGFDRPFNGNVYHYTSVAALMGILASRAMFCTDYRQLNDATELTTGFEAIEAAIAAHGIEAGISPENVDDALDRLALLQRAPFHISMFAASFSMHGNDLTQWRAYAPSHGVSIGFSLETLQRIATEQHFVCGPVRYLGAPHWSEWIAEQLAEMKDGLIKTAENEKALRLQAIHDAPETVDALIAFQRAGNLERWIAEVAGLLKNADFRSENEWRCVFVHRQNTFQTDKAVKFRNSGSRVVRFVELDLSMVDKNELFTEIIVGPGTAANETFQAVTELLRSSNVNAPVTLPQHALR